MKTAEQNAVEATFRVEGGDEPLRLISFVGHEGLSQLFHFSLQVASTSNSIDLGRLVGKPGLLSIEGAGGSRPIHGMVCQVQQQDSNHRYTVYEVTLVPRVWRLLHRRDCRIFQRRSIKQIISRVLNDATIEHRFHCHANQDPPLREYCVQYHESDWAFVSRLLEEEGFYYFFSHTDDGHQLVMGDGPEFHPGITGSDQVEYHAPSGKTPAGEHIFRFHLSESMQSGKVSLSDFNFEKPQLKMETWRVAKDFSDLEIYDYPGTYTRPRTGRKLAQVRLEEAQARRRQGEGDSDCPRLCTGHVFVLQSHGRHDLNGLPYLLTMVRHHGHKETKSLDSGALNRRLTYDNQFVCIPKAVPFRPPQVTHKPRVQGVQTAIVVGPPGEEIHTDKHGRVKVQFHWDRHGKRNPQSSCWIRVSQLWAGNGFGAIWIPRIGHEVVVDFLEGDPDRPIITGRVYHGQNVPPYALPAEKTRSAIKSRSSKGGEGHNELRFEDRKGAEEFYTHAQKDQHEVVRNDMSTRVGRDQSVKVGQDRRRTIDRDETIAVGRDRTETVGDDERITIGGDRTESVRRNERVTVRGDRGHRVKGDQTVGIHRTERMTVYQTASEQVGLAKNLMVGAGYTISVGAAMVATVGASLIQTVLGAAREQVGLVKTISVGKRFELVCGKAKITMEKGGKVTIEGKELNLKASGDVKVRGKVIDLN